MLTIDHVIVVVRQLDQAAVRFHEQYGLASVEGGRHPGHGTGNRIVPLGSSYIEMMAVVDIGEASASPLGSWVQRRLLEFGEAPVALCLGTDDIDAASRRTGRQPVPMSRTRPDGVELKWRLVALEDAISDGLPFFIQWDVDVDHPGRAGVEPRSSRVGVDWVELGGDHDRLAEWLGPHALPLRFVDGEPGPHRMSVALANGESVVIDR